MSEPVPASPRTVLTRRGRWVVCVVVTLAAAAVVVGLQALAARSTPTQAGQLDAGAPSSKAGSAAGKGTDPAEVPDPAVTGTPSGPSAGALAEPPAVVTGPVVTGPVVNGPVLNGRVQPPQVAVPTSASGQLVAVAGSTPPVTGEQVLTYRVEVEQGLPFDGVEFAAAVHATLSDSRGWPAHGYAFQRLDAEGTDFRVILASPALTDQLCAPLRTRGEVSCRNGDRVVVNALRWAEGIGDYAGDLASYREYVVNHEVGHRLGRGHVPCTGSGDPAPVMMQQTYGLDGCRPNQWPLPGE